MIDEETTPTVRVAIDSTMYERTGVLAARETATDARIVETGPTGAASLTPVVPARGRQSSTRSKRWEPTRSCRRFAIATARIRTESARAASVGPKGES